MGCAPGADSSLVEGSLNVLLSALTPAQALQMTSLKLNKYVCDQAISVVWFVSRMTCVGYGMCHACTMVGGMIGRREAKVLTTALSHMPRLTALEVGGTVGDCLVSRMFAFCTRRLVPDPRFP